MIRQTHKINERKHLKMTIRVIIFSYLSIHDIMYYGVKCSVWVEGEERKKRGGGAISVREATFKDIKLLIK